MEFWQQLNTILEPVSNIVIVVGGPLLYKFDKRLCHVELVQKLRPSCGQARKPEQ